MLFCFGFFSLFETFILLPHSSVLKFSAFFKNYIYENNLPLCAMKP